MTTTPSAGTLPFLPESTHANSPAVSVWHQSAPAPVRSAMTRGDLPGGWRAWSKHLSERDFPAHPDGLLPGGEASLDWGLEPDVRVRCSTMLSWNRSAGETERGVRRWLDEASGGAPGVEYAVEALTLTHRLPQLAERLPPDCWFGLLAHLLEAAGDAATIDPEREPLPAQLLAGELPLTLAYLFPELRPCRALAQGARKVLSAGLVDLLDGAGLVHGRHFALMRPLLACWTRCRVLGEHMKRPCFNAPARRQYGLMIRHVLRFARHDGSAMLGPAWQKGDGRLLRAAVAFGGRADDRAIARATLPSAARQPGPKPVGAALPEPAAQSEWAAAALLRSDWSRTSQRLAVVYPGKSVEVELGCGKETVLSGAWSLEVTLDGRRLEPESDWEQVCWVSDDDVDYLELEVELQEDVRVQRQMVLARQDRFLFLADAVLGERSGRLEYRSCLPLGTGIEFHPAKDSREASLHGAKPRALVLPIALPEWRSLCAAGELTALGAETGGRPVRPAPARPDASDGRAAHWTRGPRSALELTHAARAGRLYAPLFFDLDRRRFARPYTWRRLTVAEALEAVPGHVAVGYRVAVGGSQWLVYRSLAHKGNRTLLGHNLSSEALLGRFDSEGEIQPLIEVE